MELKYLNLNTFKTKTKTYSNYPGTKGHQWGTYKKRWKYHEKALEIIKTITIKNPEDVLEMGTMGIQLIEGSDTLDYSDDWDETKFSKPTYFHNAKNIPWPINKKYELFIALRVFHHLQPMQKECFEEARRIANNILIVIAEPEIYNEKYGLQVSEFCNVQYTEKIKIPNSNSVIYFWNSDSLS